MDEGRQRGLFSQLRDQVVARLEADDYLGEAPRIKVIGKDLTTISAQLQEHLTKAVGENGAGICVIAATPRVSSVDGNKILTVSVTVTVSENIVLNNGQKGSQKPSEDVSLFVFLRLLRWAPEGWGQLTAIKGASAIQLMSMGPDKENGIQTRVEYGVTLYTQTQLQFSEDTDGDENE